jgi:hypothetical protein
MGFRWYNRRRNFVANGVLHQLSGPLTMRKHQDGIKRKAEIVMMMPFHLIPSSSDHVIKLMSEMKIYRGPSRAELSPSHIVETFSLNHVSLRPSLNVIQLL